MSFEQRIRDLDGWLSALPGAVVAFSGGVDSAMLLHACARNLGGSVLAVTADSPSLPRAEMIEARQLAGALSVRHLIIATDELRREDYRRNAPDRCFHCKAELFEVISDRLRDREESGWPVLYGAITDDAGDHRPGARAAERHGVLAPLADAGLGKADVRRYCREHDLAVADKPSFACLASRVPYGTAIDAGLLAKLEAAEAVLRDLGYRQFRVRHHGDVARIELEPPDLLRAAGDDRRSIVEGVRAAGYRYVALDLVGYRTGSLNEVL
jgi:uncharacterized protein